MKVAIMTDSNSSITVDEGKSKGIYVMPLPVIVDDKTYIECETITSEELYQSMLDGKSVKTSQPSPGDLMDMWESILEEGYDEIVYIPMTKKLSGSYDSAAVFAQEFHGKVVVVNNYRLSVMLYEAVIDAKHMADNGMTAEEIKNKLEGEKNNSFMVLTVDTLSYLKNSGRVSAAKNLVASIANIKPIMMLHVEDLNLLKKARGLEMAKKKLIETVREQIDRLLFKYSKEKIVVGIIDTFVDENDAKKLYEDVKSVLGEYRIFSRKCPCSVACHVGPNAIGVSATVVTERD